MCHVNLVIYRCVDCMNLSRETFRISQLIRKIGHCSRKIRAIFPVYVIMRPWCRICYTSHACRLPAYVRTSRIPV